MNTKRVILAVAAAGVVVAGVLAVPAVAGANPFGPTRPTAAGVSGYGTGSGAGGFGIGGMFGSGRTGSPARQDRDGTCPLALDAPRATLTAAQRATLRGLAEEEKLAGDLYRVFAGRYPAAIFDRTAAAEDRHLTAVRTLLERYGLTDPTAGKPAGKFASATVQATYDRLLAQGVADQGAALTVGVQVERADIDGLQQALTGLTAADVVRVYTNLLTASRQHLAALTAWHAS